MIYQIIALLLQVIFGLLIGACLLRLYMQYQRIPMSAKAGNPIGQFVFALTDWLVLPLRKLIPGVGRVDLSSLVASLLLQLVYVGVLGLLDGRIASPLVLMCSVFFLLLHTAISGMFWLVFIFTLLSWLQPRADLYDLLQRMVSPLLNPIRSVIPLVGGVDLSSLVLLVLLQIALKIVSELHFYALRLLA
jgi:YggT family protein